MTTCNCRRCIVERGDKVRGMPRLNAEMIVCPHCGDKRCVHAEDHDAPCAKVDIYAHNAWVERRLGWWIDAGPHPLPHLLGQP